MSDNCGIPGYLLWRVANLWQKKVRSVLAPFEITPVQYLLLAGLRDLQEETGEPVKQADLARHCQSDPMMRSQVLRSLKKAELIERKNHTVDGRAFAVTLSAAGTKLLARAEPKMAQTDSLFHDPLGPEKDTFGDALRLLSGVRPRRRVKAVSG